MRRFLPLLCFLSALAWPTTQPVARHPVKPPSADLPGLRPPEHDESPLPRRSIDNVVVVLADTLRADRLTIYDRESRVRTTELSQWADHGVVFQRAYSPATWTKPAVASLFTGLYPWEHRTRVHEAVLPQSITVLPELLRESGVTTAAFVSNGYISPRFGFDRGFSHFHHSAWTPGRSGAEALVEDFFGWVDRRSSEGRFFAYLHTTDVHWPYRPPVGVLERYATTAYDRGPVDPNDPFLLRSVQRGDLVLDEADRRHLIDRYDAGVEAHDGPIGRLAKGLASRGLSSSTVVILLADHGEELLDHGSVNHGGPRAHDEIVRIPFVVWWPGMEPASHSGHPVGLVDVLPTVLDAFALPRPSPTPGRSLASCLLASHNTDRAVLGGYKDRIRFIVWRNYKLILEGELTDGRHRLFDLDADPGEFADVSGSRPKLTARLLARLRMELRETEPLRTTAPNRPASLDPDVRAQLRALGYEGDP